MLKEKELFGNRLALIAEYKSLGDAFVSAELSVSSRYEAFVEAYTIPYKWRFGVEIEIDAYNVPRVSVHLGPVSFSLGVNRTF